MGEITGGYDTKPLQLSGDINIFEVQVFGGGPGIPGMNMKVCDKFHKL
jgi:hypothetical protein